MFTTGSKFKAQIGLPLKYRLLVVQKKQRKSSDPLSGVSYGMVAGDWLFHVIPVIVLSCSLRAVLGPASEGGFDQQAERVLRAARLPAGRLRAAPRLLADLERVLQNHWPGAKVTPFGAIMAGLGMRDSDLDCYAMLPAGEHERTIYEASEVLSQHANFLHPTPVPGGKVPHVRFTHAPTGLQCDISFRSPAAVRNTLLLHYLFNLDQRALDLATIVKLWSKLHKPVGERRIMSNYAILSLVIFYLQQVSVLPPIAVLQETPNEIVEHWATAFNEMYYRSPNNGSLYELLGGFFNYYDKFDFKGKIVSVFAGTVLKRSVFASVESAPDLFSLYKRNVGQNNLEPLNISTPMCVQDAFIHNSNLAADSPPRAFLHFKSVVRFAAEAFRNHQSNYLEAIMQE